MELEEILQKEKRNEEYIFLYQEDGNWYAYEHSAFYCYPPPRPVARQIPLRKEPVNYKIR